MLLTRKIRIAPTPEQAQVLWALSEKCRLLYNFALAERHQRWTINRTKPLTYKAKKLGKKVIRIDETQTTKKCCVCGTVRDRQLSERIIHCDCGNPLDRDQNAAVNIMVQFLSQQPPVNGEPLQAFLNGLHRHTTLPHVPRVTDSMETPA